MSTDDRRNGPPAWYTPGRDLVTFANGPRVGEWAYADHFRELRRLAELNGENPATGRTLGYVPVRGETTTHPQDDRITGHVLAWSPDAATAAAKATP